MDGYDYLPVVSVLIEEDGEVLLVQEGKEHVEGMWNFPAGKLEMGESPQDGVRREALEETGVDVDLTGFVGVYLAPSDSSADRVINLVFAGEIDGDPATPEDDTVQDVAWVPLEEVGAYELRAPYIEAAVEAWRGRGPLSLDVVEDLERDV